MSIFIRIWLAFTFVLIIGGYLFFTNLEKHVKPTAQQVVEDTLIDTTRVLSSLVQDPVLSYQRHYNVPRLNRELSKKIDRAFARNIDAKVWNKHKTGLNIYIYITDQRGHVIYDSTGDNLGKDFSRWNDVYLTLKGKYGARATRINPKDPTSSVMYVAAPIYDRSNSQIMGTITVGKPNISLLPYLDRTYDKMVRTALWVGLASLILAALVAFWIRRSISKVNKYTKALATNADKPYFFLATELNDLSDSIETMRDELENKAYVTQYVHTLTHELKSPITAIQASSELLADDLPEADREQFSQNIYNQCQKLQGLVERLLLLAKLEQPSFKLKKETINLNQFISNLLKLNDSKIQKKNILVNVDIDKNYDMLVDKFWFGQALQNIIENAIHFSTGHLNITFNLDKFDSHLEITNTGKHIPEYAKSKLFDRYFSLPKEEQDAKGTGLGLTLVKEVVEKHGWLVGIENTHCHDTQSVTVYIKLQTGSVGIR